MPKAQLFLFYLTSLIIIIFFRYIYRFLSVLSLANPQLHLPMHKLQYIHIVNVIIIR